MFVCVSIFQPMNEGGLEDVWYAREMFCALIHPWKLTWPLKNDGGKTTFHWNGLTFSGDIR